MQHHDELRALNIEIGEAETRGDVPFFEDLLAPAFAMRRADGKRIDDRGAFVRAVAKSAKRATEIQSVTMFEENRALVDVHRHDARCRGHETLSQCPALHSTVGEESLAALAWANEPLS